MSSGTITLRTESVDYGGGRGTAVLTNTIGWSVDNSGRISFSNNGSWDNVGGSWVLCGENNYHLIMEPQVSYNNGASWQSLAHLTHAITSCSASTYTNAVAASNTLINQLGTYQLSGNCLLRFIYCTNSEPAPSASLPNAFPSARYSEATQTPVVVDVSWTARIKYSANGGTGAPSDTTSSSSAGSQTLTVSNTVPTRTNYRFDGWSYNSNLYHGGDTITIQKSSPTITLTAQWTEFYRPGERKVNATWASLSRSGGACERKTNDSWYEMRTIDGGSGTGDEPTRKQNGTWYNQRKSGVE